MSWIDWKLSIYWQLSIKLSVSPSVNLWKKISRFSLFTNWLKFSDNLWTDRLKQAFYKLPKISSQFPNCLITQIDANIYIYIQNWGAHIPSQTSSSAITYLNIYIYIQNWAAHTPYETSSLPIAYLNIYTYIYTELRITYTIPDILFSYNVFLSNNVFLFLSQTHKIKEAKNSCQLFGSRLGLLSFSIERSARLSRYNGSLP